MQMSFLNPRWFLVSILGAAISLSIGSYAASAPPPTQEKSDQSGETDEENDDEKDNDENKKDAKEDDQKSKKKPKKKPVPGTLIGEKIKDIIGEDVEGEEFTLSDYEGKVIMLDFWGDW